MTTDDEPRMSEGELDMAYQLVKGYVFDSGATSINMIRAYPLPRFLRVVTTVDAWDILDRLRREGIVDHPDPPETVSRVIRNRGNQ